MLFGFIIGTLTSNLQVIQPITDQNTAVIKVGLVNRKMPWHTGSSDVLSRSTPRPAKPTGLESGVRNVFLNNCQSFRDLNRAFAQASPLLMSLYSLVLDAK